MGLINTTTRTLVWINDIDVSEYLISGSVSDESSLASSIVSTTGTIQLAGSSNRSLILDYDRVSFPIGSKIEIWCTLPNGNVSRHPRGTLYVLNSKVDIQNQVLELDVGCSLAMLKQYEELYPNAVKVLYMIPGVQDQYYEIEDYTLSTLGSILEVSGHLLYQDGYGNVQLIKGIADNSAFLAEAPKATFFDIFTAINIETIENISSSPERVDIFASVDVVAPEEEEVDEEAVDDDSLDNPLPEEGTEPDGGADPLTGEDGDKDTSDNDDNTADVGKPPTRTTTTTSRIGRKIAGEHVSGLFVGKILQGQGRTLPPTCGSAINPDTPTEQSGPDYKWGIEFSAELRSLDKPFKETVTNVTETYYNAPGNLENARISYEISSHWNISSSVISAYLSSAATSVGQAVSNANNFYGVLNENLENRDQKKLEIKLGKRNENGTYVPWSTRELYQLDNAQRYYNCVASHASRNGDYWVAVANDIGTTAAGVISNIGEDNVVTSRTESYKRYGAGGEVIEETTYNYKPWVTSPKGQEGVAWNMDNVSHSRGSGDQVNVNTPVLGYDLSLILAQKTTVTYQYYPTYTIQTTEVEDYFDPLNNQKTVDISSGNTANPGEANRIQESNTLFANLTTEEEGGLLTPEEKDEFDDYAKDALNVDDEEYQDLLDEIELEQVDYCDVNTESKELSASAFIPSVTITSSNWLGTSTAVIERIDFPVTFRRIVPYRDGSGNCILSSGYSTGLYQAIMQAYASIYLKKRNADNRGIRVTEKMRSEVFGYYPFYPFDVSVSTIGKAFKCRSSAASWAFDSTNAVVSLDGYVIAETVDVEFDETQPGFVDPTTYINNVFPYLQTQAYVPLASDAGDFDSGTSDDGVSADGGEFSTNSSSNGSNLNSGNFDTGAAVPFEPPAIPPDVPIGVGSADPEADYGTNLLNSGGTVVPVSSLPALGSDFDTLINIGIEVNLALPIVYTFSWSVFPFVGYDYGKITWKTGYPLDMGTITAPNTNSFNFGSIETPTDPVVTSYVR